MSKRKPYSSAVNVDVLDTAVFEEPAQKLARELRQPKGSVTAEKAPPAEPRRGPPPREEEDRDQALRPQADTRQDKQNAGYISRDLNLDLLILAKRQGRTKEELLEEAVRAYLAQHSL